MARAFTPKVVTGNTLLDGDVVYLAEDGAWTRDLAKAELLTDEADAEIRLIEAEKRVSEVVGVYLADMAPSQQGPVPTHFREDFRRTGPSNYFHGKQTQA